MLNLAHFLERNAEIAPSDVAIYFNDTQITYAQLNAMANQVANGLRARGFGPGDRIALSCPNLPYFPAVYYGVQKLGGTVVPLNVLLKSQEIAYHLEDSQSAAYFCFEGTDELPMGGMGHEAFEQVDACREFFMIVPGGEPSARVPKADTLADLMGDQSPRGETHPASPEDTAVILYTSGTTGRPKGAELSQSNMAMNALACVPLLEVQAGDVMLLALPLFHSFGQTVQMNAGLAAGASLVLLPRFEPGAAFSAMEQHGVTHFAGVPTMYMALLNYPHAREHDLGRIAANLRIAAAGGSSLPVEVLRQFEQKYDVPILEGYGLSETAPVATFNHRDRTRKPGSVGQPLMGVAVSVVDGEDNPLAAGESGEVIIRGHNVFKGYFNRPDANAEALRGGWFHTGDIGQLDDEGYLYIVDRLKDMIIRNGMNVYPREIEEVISEYQGVAQVAVIGVPHESHGEEIKAYVMPREGVTIDGDALVEWCKERLASYKYPRLVEVVDSLPMTATGKVLKKELR